MGNNNKLDKLLGIVGKIFLLTLFVCLGAFVLYTTVKRFMVNQTFNVDIEILCTYYNVTHPPKNASPSELNGFHLAQPKNVQITISEELLFLKFQRAQAYRAEFPFISPTFGRWSRPFNLLRTDEEKAYFTFANVLRRFIGSAIYLEVVYECESIQHQTKSCYRREMEKLATNFDDVKRAYSRYLDYTQTKEMEECLKANLSI